MHMDFSIFELVFSEPNKTTDLFLSFAVIAALIPAGPVPIIAISNCSMETSRNYFEKKY